MCRSTLLLVLGAAFALVLPCSAKRELSAAPIVNENGVCTRAGRWTEEACSTQWWRCNQAGAMPQKITCREGQAYHSTSQGCAPYKANAKNCAVFLEERRLVTNMAIAGSTGQSSFGRGCYSYYANDGNLSGKGRPDSPVPPHWGFPPNSRFTCTNPGPNPFWWTSLMPGPYSAWPPKVAYVRLFSAPGARGDKLANLEVRVGSEFVKTDAAGRIVNNALCATLPGPLPGAGDGKQHIVTLKCEGGPIEGNILSVQMVQERPAQLVLAEVQVFDGPPPPLDW